MKFDYCCSYNNDRYLQFFVQKVCLPLNLFCVQYQVPNSCGWPLRQLPFVADELDEQNIWKISKPHAADNPTPWSRHVTAWIQARNPGARCNQLKLALDRVVVTDGDSGNNSQNTWRWARCDQTPDPTFSVSGPLAERYPERQCSTGLLYINGITEYLPTNGALRNLYNPTCTYTHLQDKLVDQLVSVA